MLGLAFSPALIIHSGYNTGTLDVFVLIVAVLNILFVRGTLSFCFLLVIGVLIHELFIFTIPAQLHAFYFLDSRKKPLSLTLLNIMPVITVVLAVAVIALFGKTDFSNGLVSTSIISIVTLSFPPSFNAALINSLPTLLTSFNELKILLANEATTMLHGKKAAQDSEEAAKEAFSGNSLGSNLPSIKINKTDIENKINIIDLVILSKLESSKSEIRRLIKGNAIKINDQIISDEKLIIKYDLFNEDYLKLSVGKKRHLKIEIN